MFQSLIGRLKTKKEAKKQAPPEGFQSLIGRLKTRKKEWMKKEIEEVSIPYR